jgi:hypothetical protein
VPGSRRTGAAALAVLALLAVPSVSSALAPISVQGNSLAAGGKSIRLIGVNRSGSEYACAGDDGQGGFGYAFFQGPVNNRAVAAMRKWKINAVALPLNEACWLGGYGGLKPQFSGEAYQAAIERYVNRLNANGIYVVLRLSGAGPGDHVYGSVRGSSEIPMADADHALDFWSSVATRFRDNPGVLFHAYDEPNATTWDCVLNGCEENADGKNGGPKFGPYQATGHQAIVDAIRATGATQPIIISGIDFAGDLSQWEQFMPTDPLNSLVAGFNSFDFTHNFSPQKPYLRSVAANHPIVVGGFGDSDCNSDFSEKLMRFADRIGISYLAWTWNTEADYGGCKNNALLGPGVSAYFSAHPSGYGKGVRKHFREVAG